MCEARGEFSSIQRAKRYIKNKKIIMSYYLLEYIMYSTINVKMGNKTLKTILVSLPMFVVCKIKKITNPNVIACKIPKM